MSSRPPRLRLDLAPIRHLAKPVAVNPKQIPAILDGEVLASTPLQVTCVFGLQVGNVHAELGAALVPSGLECGEGRGRKKQLAKGQHPHLDCPIWTSGITGTEETLASLE